MNDPTAVFGFPNLWDAAYKAHADVYRAIDKVQLVANELVTATKDSKVELVQVMRARSCFEPTSSTHDSHVSHVFSRT